MRKVKTIRVYNLVNSKGNQLQLELGLTDVQRDDRPWSSADKGYRWRFIGKEIPMPVRSLYWFNGFKVDTMLLWLAEHEWYVETEVDMSSGKAKVHELPEPPEEYSEYDLIQDEHAFYEVVKELNSNGKFGIAMQLVSYAHEVGHWTAREIVRNICNE